MLASAPVPDGPSCAALRAPYRSRAWPPPAGDVVPKWKIESERMRAKHRALRNYDKAYNDAIKTGAPLPPPMEARGPRAPLLRHAREGLPSMRMPTLPCVVTHSSLLVSLSQMPLVCLPTPHSCSFPLPHRPRRTRRTFSARRAAGNSTRPPGRGTFRSARRSRRGESVFCLARPVHRFLPLAPGEHMEARTIADGSERLASKVSEYGAGLLLGCCFPRRQSRQGWSRGRVSLAATSAPRRPPDERAQPEADHLCTSAPLIFLSCWRYFWARDAATTAAGRSRALAIGLALR